MLAVIMTIVAILLALLVVVVFFGLWARSKSMFRRPTPLPRAARELRGDPVVLPNYEDGTVSALHAVAWMEGEAKIIAFALLELGHAKATKDAMDQGKRAASAWHEVEPDSVPWRGEWSK